VLRKLDGHQLLFLQPHRILKFDTDLILGMHLLSDTAETISIVTPTGVCLCRADGTILSQDVLDITSTHGHFFVGADRDESYICFMRQRTLQELVHTLSETGQMKKALAVSREVPGVFAEVAQRCVAEAAIHGSSAVAASVVDNSLSSAVLEQFDVDPCRLFAYNHAPSMLPAVIDRLLQLHSESSLAPLASALGLMLEWPKYHWPEELIERVECCVQNGSQYVNQLWFRFLLSFPRKRVHTLLDLSAPYLFPLLSTTAILDLFHCDAFRASLHCVAFRSSIKIEEVLEACASYIPCINGCIFRLLLLIAV